MGGFAVAGVGFFEKKEGGVKHYQQRKSENKIHKS